MLPVMLQIALWIIC